MHIDPPTVREIDFKHTKAFIIVHLNSSDVPHEVTAIDQISVRQSSGCKNLVWKKNERKET